MLDYFQKAILAGDYAVQPVLCNEEAALAGTSVLKMIFAVPKQSLTLKAHDGLVVLYDKESALEATIKLPSVLRNETDVQRLFWYHHLYKNNFEENKDLVPYELYFEMLPFLKFTEINEDMKLKRKCHLTVKDLEVCLKDTDFPKFYDDVLKKGCLKYQLDYESSIYVKHLSTTSEWAGFIWDWSGVAIHEAAVKI